MNEHEDLYRTLDSRLRELSKQLGMMPSRYFELFDEFLNHREFGLALETLCDCLLESRQTPASDAIVDEIEALHAIMKVSDDCVALLRRTK